MLLLGAAPAAAGDHAFLVSNLNKRPNGFFYSFNGPNGTLLFRNADYTHGDELWITDGTASGTPRLLSLGLPCFNLLRRYGAHAAVGSQYFFVAADPDHGMEPWKTDGTPEGTSLVRDIRPGPDYSRTLNPLFLQDR